MNIEHLHSIRSAELEQILPILAEFSANKHGTTMSILELGSGTGWQAKQLSEKTDYDIEAIDIESSNYADMQVWPVTIYDGRNIPFPDEHFDVLFSSNVLEHIPHLKDFHNEMQRVLKSNGIAIHIVPSGSWRFWTNIAHYPFILKTVIQKLFRKYSPPPGGRNDDQVVDQKLKSSTTPISSLIRTAIFPVRHGETGNALSEIYHFSKFGWTKLFEGSSWAIRQYSGSRLFYTGYMFFNLKLPCKIRRPLSYILGSSCHVFVLEESDN